MKLFGLLRKPDWEHKNAALRLRAVQSSQDPQLLAKLAELVQTDPDPGVRAAALRRIDDPALLERRLRGEHDASVAAAARKRLIDVLCSSTVMLDAGSAALLQTHDAELLTRVAEDSPLPALRKLALERCGRPALFIQRCIHDPDPALRLWLLDRIDAPDALQKIADAARKRDKRLTRAARDKLEALQLAADDGPALIKRVLSLCDQLGRLGRELPDGREAQLVALREAWLTVRLRVDADLQRRADGSLAMAEAALSAARGEPIPRSQPAQPEPLATDPVPAEALVELPPAAVAAPPEPALDALLARLPAVDAEDFDAQLRSIRDLARQYRSDDNATVQAQQQALRAAIEARLKQRREAETQAHIERAHAQLTQLETALQDGSLNVARSAREVLGRSVPRELQRRLADADEGLAKLERWQRWSGSKVRMRLCDDAEALRGSGVHPDALANKVKELKAEWARLDGIEGAAAPGPEHGLTRRFRALCHHALAPARPYFEKRRELRGERSEQIGALVAAAATLPEGTDALQALRKQIRDALPELDGVSPETRGELGRQLRERLTAIDAAMAELREQAALGKRRLIARLRRDLGTADPTAAIDLAKTAQSEWKRLPRSERTLEDTLWTEFRSLIDPLFAQVREQESDARARSAEADANAQAILAELDALASAEHDRLLHAGAHLESLQARWRALTPAETPRSAAPERAARGGREAGNRRDSGPRDGRRDSARPPPRSSHPQESRFEAASARVLVAQQQALREREQQHIARICAAGELLDQLTSASGDPREALLDQFRQIETQLPADARSALASRWQMLLDGGTELALDADAAELLAVRAELIAGIDSPAHAGALRRQEQMQRLAAKLAGQQTADPRAVVRGLLIELQSLPGLETSARRSLQPRILAAYEAISKA